MKKMRIKLTFIVVALFIVMNTMLSFAEPTNFTDIGGHWAKEYIEDVYGRQLIRGYPSGRFEPEGNITKTEAMVIVAGLMGHNDENGQLYAARYKQKLENNNIPDWAQGAVAYALFNDILLEDELGSFVSTKGQTPAKRHEVATYIGKVLQYGAGEEIDELINIIPYEDKGDIPEKARPYVELLLDKGILDETSNEGCFLPNNPITRAEVAKMVSMSAKILDDVSDDDVIMEPELTSPPEIIVIKTIDGSIENVIFGDKNFVCIRDKKGSGSGATYYEVDSKATISVDGRTAAIRQLEMGQAITAVIEEDVIIDIKAHTDKEILEGNFLYYTQYEQIPKVFINDDKGKTHTLLFTDNSRAYFMDKAVHIEELNWGDMVTVTYVGDEVIEIEAGPKEKYFEGIVKAKNDKKGEYALEVLLDDKTVEIFDVDSKATLKRDKRSVNFKDIKIGDEVEIVTEYKTITSINAFSIKRTVEGYIKKMAIGQKPEPIEIIVEKYDGTAEIFELTPDTVIRVEEERAGIYDLRLNYEVELEIENDEVLWVEAYQKFQSSIYSGKVSYINVRRDVLELEAKNREEIEIYVGDETIYNDEDGYLIELRDIYVGDEIVVVAEDKGHYTTAKRVIVITRR